MGRECRVVPGLTGCSTIDLVFFNERLATVHALVLNGVLRYGEPVKGLHGNDESKLGTRRTVRDIQVISRY